MLQYMTLNITLPDPTKLDSLTGHISRKTRRGLERLQDHDCSQIEELAGLLADFSDPQPLDETSALPDAHHQSYDAYFGVTRTETARREALAYTTLHLLYRLGVDAKKTGSLDALTRLFFLNSLKTIAQTLLVEPPHAG